MKVVRHNTAAEFLAKAGDWLERAEAENNLILGTAAFFASSNSIYQRIGYGEICDVDDWIFE